MIIYSTKSVYSNRGNMHFSGTNVKLIAKIKKSNIIKLKQIYLTIKTDNQIKSDKYYITHNVYKNSKSIVVSIFIGQLNLIALKSGN